MGTVLISFEDNALVGVKFDDKTPGGNDLGGLCDVGHGYFCPCNFLYIFEFILRLLHIDLYNLIAYLSLLLF